MKQDTFRVTIEVMQCSDCPFYDEYYSPTCTKILGDVEHGKTFDRNKGEDPYEGIVEWCPYLKKGIEIPEGAATYNIKRKVCTGREKEFGNKIKMWCDGRVDFIYFVSLDSDEKGIVEQWTGEGRPMFLPDEPDIPNIGTLFISANDLEKEK